jgi:signal transduction histidine kinase/ligand-binding sensor domain-containing protein
LKPYLIFTNTKMPDSMKYFSLLLSFLLVCVSGCSNTSDQVPFPHDETEFTQPVTKPFKFSEPTTIKWKTVRADSIKPPTIKKFSLDKIPSKPFNIGNAKPLPKPLTEKPFDWNSLPDTVFNINDLPADTLKNRTIKLLPPKVVKAGSPMYAQGLPRGFLDATSIGLPGTARDFLKDPSGALWIGTSKGLCRYDGGFLEIYSLEQGLPFIDITSLFRDNKNRIWVGIQTGDTYVIDEKAGTIELLEDIFPANQGSTYKIIQDDEGRIWIPIFGNGVVIYEPETRVARQLNHTNGLPGFRNRGIMKDTEGLIWIASFNGVAIIDLKANKVRTLDQRSGLSTNGIIDVFQASTGEIWLGSISGASIVDRKNNKLRLLEKEQQMFVAGSKEDVAGISEDASGKMWMAVNDGYVYSIDLKNNLFESFHVNPGAVVLRTLTDDEGQVWIGSFNGSTPLFNPKLGRPGNYTNADGLGNTSIWATLEAKDGKIWIGTRNGIDVYNPAQETIQHISTDNGLAHNSAPTLLEDSQGRIWVGNNGNGLHIIDLKKQTLAQVSTKQGLPDDDTSAFFEDQNGDMWVTSATGVSVINPDKGLIRKISNLHAWKDAFYFQIYGDSKNQIWILSTAGVMVVDAPQKTVRFLNRDNGLSGESGNAIMEDSDGNVWIGSLSGIDIINPSHDSITTITSSEGLADNGIYTLNERNGKIYAGTTNGLSIITPTIDKNNKLTIKTTNLGKAQGLGALDFAQNSTMFTKKGQYWAGVETLVLLVMDSVQLDTARSTPQVAAVNFFDQRHDFRNRTSLPADDYLIKNNIQWDSVETTFYMPYNLVVPYNQNYVSFNYSAMQLSNPDKLRYRYILEGIDKNWSAITDKTLSENYRDLPPGTYTFKVASRGINGLWSKPATFTFEITAPWWKTWWAYTLYAIAFFGFMTLVVRFRSRTLKRQNQILEEKVENRTNALQKSLNELQETQKQLIQSEKMASLGELTAGIAHEIQNPLNFVNNFAEVNKELIDELKQEIENGNLNEVKTIATALADNESKIMFHGKRADGIVKSMLQHSRTSNNKKEPTNINALADEYLRLAYHGLRAKDKSFNASMKTDFDERVEKVNVVGQDVGRVILNLITNAFYAVAERKQQGVSGYEPTVTVGTRKKENGVEIFVQDNGNGIPQHIIDKIFQPFFTTKPSGQGTGLGLSMSYEIITKGHDGELKVETKENEGLSAGQSGTTFTILLPNTPQ